MRVLAAGALLVALLAGCTQPDPTSPPTAAPPATFQVPELPTVDAAALLAELQSFAATYPQRHDNVETHEGARTHVLGEYAKMGLQAWRQDFDAGGLTQANLVGIQWGQVRDEVVVVGGHYDTTHDDCIALPDCPAHAVSEGAYDDGSGSLLTLHLARAWANVTPYYSIAFVLYDGEERGLQGATAFVEAFLDGATPFGNATLRAALDIDMFGITWPGTNAPTQVLDNSEALFGHFTEVRKGLGMPDSMVYRKDPVTLGSSDFAVYFREEVPTIFFSSDFGQFAAPAPAPEQAHLPAGVYPFWHLADTYANMELSAGGAAALEAGFTTAGQVTAAMLHHMADLPDGV